MKFLRPVAPKTSNGTKPTTFGQARAARIEHRLAKAKQERAKLVRAQYAAEDPLNTIIEQKANALDAKINRLKNTGED